MPLQNDHAESLLEADELAALAGERPAESDPDTPVMVEDSTDGAADSAVQAQDESDATTTATEDDATAAEAAADAPAIEAEADAAAEAGAAEGAPAAAVDAPAPAAQPESDPLPAALESGDPAAFAAQRAELAKQAAAARKQWREGELSDEEFDEREARFKAEHDALLVAETEARTVANVSRQFQKAAFDRALDDYLGAREAEDGIKYRTGAKMRGEFVAAMTAQANDAIERGEAVGAPELFRRSYEALHAQYEADGAPLRRPKAAPPAAAPAAPTKPAAPAPRAARPAPPTLAAMPAAAPSELPMDDSIRNQLASLQGEDFEIAVAKLSKAQRDRIMQES